MDGMVEREALRWRDEVEGSSAEARLGVVRELSHRKQAVKGKGKGIISSFHASARGKVEAKPQWASPGT